MRGFFVWIVVVGQLVQDRIPPRIYSFISYIQELRKWFASLSKITGRLNRENQNSRWKILSNHVIVVAYLD